MIIKNDCFLIPEEILINHLETKIVNRSYKKFLIDRDIVNIKNLMYNAG